MKNKFLNICIGTGILFVSAGFFVRSINLANAAPSPKQFIEEGTNKIGKYMMSHSISSGGHGGSNSDDDIGGIIVWDTETGESTYYTFIPAYNGSPDEWKQSKAQLPKSPVAK